MHPNRPLNARPKKQTSAGSTTVLEDPSRGVKQDLKQSVSTGIWYFWRAPGGPGNPGDPPKRWGGGNPPILQVGPGGSWSRPEFQNTGSLLRPPILNSGLPLGYKL